MHDEDAFKKGVDAAVQFAQQYDAGLQAIIVDHYLRMSGPSGERSQVIGAVDPGPSAPAVSPARPTTVAELARKRKPKSGTQHMLVAAAYLEGQQEYSAGWSKEVLFGLFREMRFNPTNPHDIVTKAKRAGLLMEGPDGFLLTQSGLDAYREFEGGDDS